MHVKPQVALGALPVHTCGAVHILVVETKRQELASVAQVACVCVSWHTLPLAVQIDGLQEHVATLLRTPHN